MTDIQWQSAEDDLPYSETITISDVKFNVLHMCLVLETIGLYAEYLGERYQPFLIKSMHRILEKSGKFY